VLIYKDQSVVIEPGRHILSLHFMKHLRTVLQKGVTPKVVPTSFLHRNISPKSGVTHFFRQGLQVTNSKEQKPSREANNHSASQEIPRLLWKHEVHYPVLKSLPCVKFRNILFSFTKLLAPAHSPI